MNKLEIIKKGLKHGDMVRIAKATRKSWRTVASVLRGERKNERILKAAEALAEKNRKDDEEAIKTLTETTPQD